MENTQQTNSLASKMIITIVLFIIIGALGYLYFNLFILKNANQVAEAPLVDEQEAQDKIRRDEMTAAPLVQIDLNENRKTEIQQDLRDKPTDPSPAKEKETNLRSELTS